jgi:AhpD family alkylhydroperoxidase
MADMKQTLNDFMLTLKQIGETDKGYADALMSFIQQSEKPGALSTKVKELISLALGVTANCSYCIAIHTYNAIKEGATRQEILEAAFAAGLMGGGPAVAYIRYVIDACDQFGAK